MPAQRIEERRRDAPRANGWADPLRIVKESEQVGVWQQAAKRLQHSFPASPVQEPVMNDGCAHISDYAVKLGVGGRRALRIRPVPARSETGVGIHLLSSR